MKAVKNLAGKWMCLALGALILGSCSEGEGTAEEELMGDLDTNMTFGTVSSKVEHAKNIFNAIPSPLQTFSIIQKSGGYYNADFLNDPNKVDQYVSNKDMSLNLGVFAADLCYTSIFEESSETMLFMASCQKLADKLGVANAISQDMIDRLDINKNQRDSLVHIISEIYYTLDEYLVESSREDISAIMILGGWVEGLYIFSQMLDLENPKPELDKVVANQKSSVGQMRELLNSYDDKADLEDLKKDVERLSLIFDKITLTRVGETKAREENGVTVLGAQTELDFPLDAKKELIEAVSEIRGRYIR